MPVRIGTSGWSYDHWEGILYPHGARARARLRYYVPHFSTVELNTTGYRLPREELHQSLSTADVHLISMRREMTGIVVPGKLYGAMASGRPALFVGPDHCESADTIREAGCGPTVRQGDTDGLVEALERLADEPELATRMGARGRSAFLAGHERDACCDRWGWAIGELLGTTTVRMPDPTPVAVPAAATVLRRVG